MKLTENRQNHDKLRKFHFAHENQMRDNNCEANENIISNDCEELDNFFSGTKVRLGYQFHANLFSTQKHLLELSLKNGNPFSFSTTHFQLMFDVD